MKKSLRFISLLIAVVFMISGAVMVICHADEGDGQTGGGGQSGQSAGGGDQGGQGTGGGDQGGQTGGGDQGGQTGGGDQSGQSGGSVDYNSGSDSGSTSRHVIPPPFCKSFPPGRPPGLLLSQHRFN